MRGGGMVHFEPRPAGVCFLLGAGPLYGWAADKRPGDFLIAADGGYAYAVEAGWTPDLLLGDFDSLGRVPDAAGTLVLPREKDDTDMLAAAREGLKRGFSTFYILGGTGGRMDHTLANIQLLAFLADAGAVGYLFAEHNVLRLLRAGEVRYPAGLTGYVSVLAYGGAARGVCLEGLKYPMQNGEMTPSFPIGTSNEFLGAPARVAVGEGSVLLIYPRAEAQA